MLPHPSECSSCLRLHRLSVAKVRSLNTKVPVLTWCRICGLPVLLQIVKEYKYARRHFEVLDRQPMVCKNTHAEQDSWGIHWRLDEALAAVFEQHNEICWPTPPWYQHQNSKEHPVTILSAEQLEDFSAHRMHIEMRMLQEWLNQEREPQQILDLLSVDRVYDPKELQEEFEVLTFQAPFIVVIKKSTGQRGTLLFQDRPRYYFSFSPDRLL